MAAEKIILDFCSEPVDLYCPVCSELLFKRGEKQGCCSHLLFSAESATGRWEWLDESYLPLFNTLVEGLYDEVCGKGYHGTLADFISTMSVTRIAAVAADAVTRKSAFMFSVSTSDIGCGGMYNGTLHALFDYSPQQRKTICEMPVIKKGSA